MEPQAREAAWGMSMARKLAFRLAPAGADHADLGVDELTSVGLIALARALRSYDPNRGVTLRTWVHGQVQWAIRAEIQIQAREQARRPIVPLIEAVDLVDGAEGPEAYAIYHDMLRGIRRMVSKLPPRERDVIRLRYWGEMTYKEIGRRLGIHESRAYQIHADALLRLRAWMECDAPGSWR